MMAGTNSTSTSNSLTSSDVCSESFAIALETQIA
ncbi:hypothetical protein PI125_g15339 [Phytophthora idaei]|nr:hypothetical protein PI125_g15339 [Phytophthora idaei]